MPSGSPVSGLRDAEVYGAKEKATPKAGYHEKQKDSVSAGQKAKSSTFPVTVGRPECCSFPLEGVWCDQAASSRGLPTSDRYDHRAGTVRRASCPGHRKETAVSDTQWWRLWCRSIVTPVEVAPGAQHWLKRSSSISVPTPSSQCVLNRDYRLPSIGTP